jgi:hypothetical protein
MTTTKQSPFRRRTSRAGLAVTASALIVTVAAVTPAVAGAALHFRSDLRDLEPAVAGPFDDARARLTLVPGERTKAVFVVRGVDRSVRGRTFGAHLHSGPCVAGDGAAALGHYNHSTTTPPRVNDHTEIWLDIRVDREGHARSTTRVHWAPTAGMHSVVIHANPTAVDGTAGPRIACLPVEW